MAMQLPASSGDARSEPPTWTALVLEMVALRHQIAVLKRSGTRRPSFRFSDRLFWLLLAWQQRGQPKSPREQEAVQALRNDPQMRAVFIDKVAAPIANKMFECGLLP
jgi:hypothetical protein